MIPNCSFNEVVSNSIQHAKVVVELKVSTCHKRAICLHTTSHDFHHDAKENIYGPLVFQFGSFVWRAPYVFNT